MKKILFLFFILLIDFYAYSQKSIPNNIHKDLYAKQWEKISKLIEQNRPKAAAHLIDSVYEIAIFKNEPVIILKAQLYFLQIIHDTSENELIDLIAISEKHAKEEKLPYNAIWQSITAQLYWNYYQTNRLKILERPSISRDIVVTDFENWDANRFFDKTAALYLKSISHTEELKNFNMKDFAPIIFGGENSIELRPTLFDFLVFRALDYFENDDKDIIAPENSFIMEDPTAFAPAGAFVNQKFATKDLTSYKWLTLQWYKQLLAMHESDSSKNAYLDIDLNRLAFVYKNSVLANKKQLYLQSLQFIEDSYADNPISAAALLTIATILGGFENLDSYFLNNENGTDSFFKLKNGIEKVNFEIVTAKLKYIISKFPNGDCTNRAKTILSFIENKSFKFETENVVLPKEPSKFLLNYRNTNKIWVHIIQLSNLEFRKRINNDFESWKKQQLKKTPITNFSITLPNTEDYYEHQTEVKIGALPEGIYLLCISLKNNFSSDSNLIQSNIFQVSNLSYIGEFGNEPDLKDFILNRKTGEPIAHAFVSKYKNYDTKNSYDKTKTHKDGSFVFKRRKQDDINKYINIIYEKDTLWDDYKKVNLFYEEETSIKNYFITDCSLYQPGQTVYFKGIMVRKRKNGMSEVLKNRYTDVQFVDETGFNIKTLFLKTNNFGSFTGQFIVPTNSFTHKMIIKNEFDSISVNVEEYKKPKFHLEFEPTKTSYYINDIIKLNGNLTAFSGNILEGAKVKFSIVRNRINLNNNYNNNVNSVSPQNYEIYNGATQTDKDGKFAISFKAVADSKIEKIVAPVFSYNVFIYITCSNEESVCELKTFRAGYANIQILDYLPAMAKPDELDTLIIKTEDIEGKYISANLQIQISWLQTPDHVYRKRLWNMPDVFIIDSIEYRKNFPLDEYKNESSFNFWPIEKKLIDTIVPTKENGFVNIPINVWNKNGMYVVELKSKDTKGNEIYCKKYVEVWDENNNGKIPDAIQLTQTNIYAEPGDTPEIKILSGFDTATIIQNENILGKPEICQKLQYKKSPINWNRLIAETDRGGLALSFLLLKNNRLYTKKVAIHIPWNNKKIDLKWETNTDSLSSNKFKNGKILITNNKQENNDVEMLVSINSILNEAFKPAIPDVSDLFSSVFSDRYWYSDILTGEGKNLINAYTKQHYISTLKTQSKLIVVGNDFKYMNYENNSLEKERLKLLSLDHSVKQNPNNEIQLTRKSGKHKKIEQKKNKTNKNKTNKNNILEKQKENSEDIVSVQNKFTNQLLLKDSKKIFSDSGISVDLNSMLENKITKSKNETFFFYPQLTTDTAGYIQFIYTIPENYNELKLTVYAHSKNMATGVLEEKIKPNNSILVEPKLPRFLKQGDSLIIYTKITNQSDSLQNGNVSLHLFGALTLKSIDSIFRLQKPIVYISLKKGKSSYAKWSLKVPQSLFEPVKMVITANYDNYNYKDENVLQLLNNMAFVTQTFPFVAKGNTTKSYLFNKLIHSNTDKTITNFGLTYEYTKFPLWYAIQSFPYLMNCNYDNSEQTFNNYFANTIATNIVSNSPKVEDLFANWKEEDSIVFSLNQLKNPDLKSKLIDETPWILEAKNETEQKNKLANLFDIYKLKHDQKNIINKLQQLQLPSGGFPWFKGMEADKYITQYIITGLGKLLHLGIENTDEINVVIKNALHYLDKQMKAKYDALLKNNEAINSFHINNEDVQYLYMRSYFKDISIPKTIIPLCDFIKKQAIQFNDSFNMNLKGMIAISLYRSGDSITAKTILNSIKKSVLAKPEQAKENCLWYSWSIEKQALLIECLEEIENDTALIESLKIDLIKQKLAYNWQTTIATADACYAFLLGGKQLINDKQQLVNIQLGGEELQSNNQIRKPKESNGFFRLDFEGDNIKPQLGNIKISVIDNIQNTSWGTAYWQYFKIPEKNKLDAMPLKMYKQLYVANNSSELLPITKQTELKIGDKAVVRIEIFVEKEMDYILLKDRYASCFEPKYTICGYKSVGGFGYYEMVKDASVNFYINHINRGKYVFEYSVTITHSGEFSTGDATIQCIYAPEVMTQSEDTRITVLDNKL